MTDIAEDGLDVTSIAPSVAVGGSTVKPEGWVWVLGFALAGSDRITG
jgi:hypothetical protein